MDGGDDFGAAHVGLDPMLDPGGWGPTDASPLEQLLAQHRDLVLEIAARYARPGVDTRALVSAGIRGLIDAIVRFDPSCGVFSDFAAWWIRQSVLRASA